MMKAIVYILSLISFTLTAQFTKPQKPVKKIIFDGNSLFVYGADVLGGNRTPVTCMSLMPLPKNIYCNYAVGSRRTTVLTNEFDTKIAPYAKAGDIVIIWEITNSAHDHIGDTNGDTLYSEIQAYCAKARSYGLYVYVLTGIPRFQSGYDDAGITSRINACNTKLRSGWSGFCDGLIDIAATSTFSSATSYTNTTYYETDGTHLKDRGCDSVGYKIYREIPH